MFKFHLICWKKIVARKKMLGLLLYKHITTRFLGRYMALTSGCYKSLYCPRNNVIICKYTTIYAVLKFDQWFSFSHSNKQKCTFGFISQFLCQFKYACLSWLNSKSCFTISRQSLKILNAIHNVKNEGKNYMKSS